MSTDIRRQGLEIDCGADTDVAIPLYDGSEGTTALDLTGVTDIQLLVKKQMSADWPVVLDLKKSTGDIAVVGLATEGNITVTFESTDTLDTDVRIDGYFEHELWVEDSSHNWTRVLSGRLTIWPTGRS
jgi:hypothetical protein